MTVRSAGTTCSCHFADAHGPRVSRRDPINVQRWLWIVADDMHMSPDFNVEVICVTGS
jgi:hypothetical protein